MNKVLRNSKVHLLMEKIRYFVVSMYYTFRSLKYSNWNFFINIIHFWVAFCQFSAFFLYIQKIYHKFPIVLFTLIYDRYTVIKYSNDYCLKRLVDILNKTHAKFAMSIVIFTQQIGNKIASFCCIICIQVL